jgi:hypothetical protein
MVFVYIKTQNRLKTTVLTPAIMNGYVENQEAKLTIKLSLTFIWNVLWHTKRLHYVQKLKRVAKPSFTRARVFGAAFVSAGRAGDALVQRNSKPETHFCTPPARG